MLSQISQQQHIHILFAVFFQLMCDQTRKRNAKLEEAQENSEDFTRLLSTSLQFIEIYFGVFAGKHLPTNTVLIFPQNCLISN